MFVLEDAAQSFGALYKGRRAPALAMWGRRAFSRPNLLDATVTEERSLRMTISGGHDAFDHPARKRSHKYENIRIGVNGRLDTLQAAILLAKLEVFQNELDHRQRVAETYSAGLQEVLRSHSFLGHGQRMGSIFNSFDRRMNWRNTSKSRESRRRSIIQPRCICSLHLPILDTKKVSSLFPRVPLSGF